MYFYLWNQWQILPEKSLIRKYRLSFTFFTIQHLWLFIKSILGDYFSIIDRIIDELFENYLSRPNVRQPILTQYCDGKQVQCRNRGRMTQWGSKALGDQGYSAIEILRAFYGNDMYINVAEAISGIPSSWPGYDLDIGASGNKVRQIQEQLNTIAAAYPAVPVVTADGIYGPETQFSCFLSLYPKTKSFWNYPVTNFQLIHIRILTEVHKSPRTMTSA